MAGIADVYGRGYFAANYRDYDRQNPPSKLAFYRRLVERHTQGVAAPRVLELGCAFGLFLRSLGRRYRRVGIDLSHFALSAAAKADSGIHFIQADSARLPLSEQFDAVAAFDVIEHVPDLAALADTIRSAVRTGGVFIFVVPVYDGPLGWLVRLLDRDPTHLHKKSRGWWLSWAAKQGSVVEWLGVFRGWLPGGRYIHAPTRLFRGIAPAIAVVVRLPAAQA
ncbi:MAG: class I SAM-dependent methyltransferase [Bryobacteraceae bacterium]|nr:class I SAM-dependent methyltransferase [Bryobacteraceae bacterium]